MKKNKLEQNHTAHAISAQLSEKPEAPESRSEIERLRKEIERLKDELQREHEMYVRNLADFDNYRRRVERERKQAAQAGKRELILPLLEVMDDFESALERANEDPKLMVEGARVIHHRLTGLLSAHGVKAFESHGKYFNPLMHEAVDRVKNEGAEPGRVLEEISRGWRWGDDLLRPARVRVAQ